MTNVSRNMQAGKQARDRSGVNPVVAGAIGATVGVVAATLADAQKRKKMRDAVTNMMEDFKTQSDKIRHEAMKKMDDVQRRAGEMQQQMENGSARKIAKAAAARTRGAQKGKKVA